MNEPTTQDRLLESFRAIVRAEDPNRTYRGVFEYAVQATDGNTIDASPTDTTIPLPALAKVPIRGQSITPTVGARAIVGFINADPTRPYVLSIDPPHVNETHAPSGVLALGGGGFATTEHVATVEATVNMFINFVYLLNTAGNPSTWTSGGKLLDPLSFPTNLVTALTTWLSNCASILAPTASTGGGLLYPTTIANIASALSAKTSDVTGELPSIGAPSVKSG